VGGEEVTKSDLQAAADMVLMICHNQSFPGRVLVGPLKVEDNGIWVTVLSSKKDVVQNLFFNFEEFHNGAKAICDMVSVPAKRAFKEVEEGIGDPVVPFSPMPMNDWRIRIPGGGQ
jgi:hypothetical protein